MSRFVVDTADYEAAVLYTAMVNALERTMRLAVEQDRKDPIGRGVAEHFELSFWHLVCMMKRMYPRR